jgi:hypothetical protein
VILVSAIRLKQHMIASVAQTTVDRFKFTTASNIILNIA